MRPEKAQIRPPRVVITTKNFTLEGVALFRHADDDGVLGSRKLAR